MEILKNEAGEELKTFFQWFVNYLNHKDHQTMPQTIEDMVEVRTMFAESLKRYEQELLQQGKEHWIQHKQPRQPVYRWRK